MSNSLTELVAPDCTILTKILHNIALPQPDGSMTPNVSAVNGLLQKMKPHSLVDFRINFGNAPSGMPDMPSSLSNVKKAWHDALVDRDRWKNLFIQANSDHETVIAAMDQEITDLKTRWQEQTSRVLDLEQTVDSLHAELGREIVKSAELTLLVQTQQQDYETQAEAMQETVDRLEGQLHAVPVAKVVPLTAKEWDQLQALDAGETVHGKTVRKLCNRGLCNKNGELTDAGRAEAEKDRPAEPKKRPRKPDVRVTELAEENAGLRFDRDACKSALDDVAALLETVDDPEDANQQALASIQSFRDRQEAYWSQGAETASARQSSVH